jgi:low affinity Fe/Cu permease
MAVPRKDFSFLLRRLAYWVGTKSAFVAALFIVPAWLVSGPYFHYSDTWQLVINTGTTVVMFLVVFLFGSIGSCKPRENAPDSVKPWGILGQSEAAIAFTVL